MNPCKERAAGCTGTAPRGAKRCESCRAVHNAREAARRAARRAAFACWVCGAPAERIAPGVYACTCSAHAHYRAERKAEASV